MVSTLDAGSNHGQGHSRSASLHLRVEMGTSKFNAGGNPVMD